MTPFEALVDALALAITAPTDADAAWAVALAESFADGLPVADIARAQALAAAQVRRSAAAIIARIDTWHVPPEAQGQMVEDAYGVDTESGLMVRRTTSRASGRVGYAMAPAPARWEPWNREPDSDAWVVIREAHDVA